MTMAKGFFISTRVPTVAQLRAFVAVAEKLHFRDAAAELGMSQPALSGSVAALEDALGTRLVERTTRRVLLTRSGELVAERARRVLDEVENLVAVAQSTGRPFTGDLHLGVIPTVAPYLLPALLRPVREAYPELSPILHEEQTASIEDGLATGRLDAALLATAVDSPGHCAIPLYSEDFLLIVPADHPSAGRGPVCLATLRDLDVLLMEEGHCLRDQTLDLCHEVGARGLGSTRAASLATLVQLVAGGLGATLLPHSAASVEARRGSGLASARFVDPAPRRSVSLVYRASSVRAAEFTALAETIRQAVRDRRLPVRVADAADFADVVD
jgi:LysR family hydrogen peroxide-inducible transcriptional activator